MDRQSLLDALMAVMCPLQILSATASRSLLVKGRGETPVISLPLLEYEAIMRRTLLPRMGYHEGLIRIQLWLHNSLMQQRVFDICDLLLSKMDYTIAEGFRGHMQLPYAH